MKRILLLLCVILGLQAYAVTYPYMTIETTDGMKASFPSDGLEISISGDMLTVKEATYRISNLSKMYFSEGDVTSGITANFATDLTDDTEIFDLGGNRVRKEQMRKGIYLVRNNDSTYKIVVK